MFAIRPAVSLHTAGELHKFWVDRHNSPPLQVAVPHVHATVLAAVDKTFGQTATAEQTVPLQSCPDAHILDPQRQLACAMLMLEQVAGTVAHAVPLHSCPAGQFKVPVTQLHATELTIELVLLAQTGAGVPQTPFESHVLFAGHTFDPHKQISVLVAIPLEELHFAGAVAQVLVELTQVI